MAVKLVKASLNLKLPVDTPEEAEQYKQTEGFRVMASVLAQRLIKLDQSTEDRFEEPGKVGVDFHVLAPAQPSETDMYKVFAGKNVPANYQDVAPATAVFAYDPQTGAPLSLEITSPGGLFSAALAWKDGALVDWNLETGVVRHSELTAVEEYRVTAEELQASWLLPQESPDEPKRG